MDLKKKIIYSIIRISVLLLIVGCVSNYYKNECEIYKDKMFEAMEERDNTKDEIADLRAQLGFVERELSSEEEYTGELELLVDRVKYKSSEELNAAMEEIAWHEERWDTLVKQKNGTNFSVRSNSGTSHFVMLSSYIGDQTANVYHISSCDLLEAINDDDKIDLGNSIFSIRSDYKPCAWCLSKKIDYLF